MTWFVAVAVFPLLGVALATGGGLLVDRLSGSWLPAPAIPVVGLAALIVIGQLLTYSSVTARATPLAFVLFGCVGVVAGRLRLVQHWDRRRNLLGPTLALVAAYGIALAPVLALGRTTLAGYLIDTTTGTHLAGADWLLHHGRDFSGIGDDSSYGLQVRAYFETNNYPAGAHVLLAGLGALTPTRLTWVYQPFMALVAAFVAPGAWLILRKAASAGVVFSAVAATVCSVPALVYALGLAGSIKEITALPLIVLLGVFVTEHRRWLGQGPLRVLPFAVTTAAGLSTIGLAFVAWAAATALVLCTLIVVSSEPFIARLRRLAPQAGVFVCLCVVGAPAISLKYSQAAGVASNIAATTDPGNLTQPLRPVQALGIWLTGQYRVEPTLLFRTTYALIGVAVLLCLAGIIGLAKVRAWGLLAWLGLLALLWWQLSERGTTWTDGKLILLSSPAVLLLLCAGVVGLRRQGSAVVALMAGTCVVGGVMYSDVLQYRETNLAPTRRFDEMATINARFAGQGPTLLTDFDEFAFYELRDLKVSAPGFAFRPAGVAATPTGYGQTVDADSVSPATFATQQLVVQRRSPVASRPPSDFRRVFNGEFYDVWKRRAPSTQVLVHQGTSDSESSQDVVACDRVRQLSKVASAAKGELLVAHRSPTVYLPAASLGRSPGFVGDQQLSLTTPGRIETSVLVRKFGRYDIWLKGQIGRPLRVLVDGVPLGRVGQQSAGLGNFLTPLEVSLKPGRHQLSVVRPGGSLRPGDKTISLLDAIVISGPGGATTSEVRRVAPRNYEDVCGQLVDWVEAVR